MTSVRWSSLRASELSQVDPDDARNRAEGILSRPEFGDPSPGWMERALDRFVGWIDNILGPLLGPIGSGGVKGASGIVILVVLVAIVAFVVVRVVRGWEPLLVDHDEDKVTSSRETGLSADQWRQNALSHEAAGEWSAAVRCHHRATVVELASKAGLAEAVGSTSGQWRDEAADRELGDLAPLTELFDEVWYGGTPANSAHAKAAGRNPLLGDD